MNIDPKTFQMNANRTAAYDAANPLMPRDPECLKRSVNNLEEIIPVIAQVCKDHGMIVAIRTIRDMCKCNLGEAKDFVEFCRNYKIK